MINDIAPVLGVLLATLIVLFGAIEFGFRLGGRSRERYAGDKEIRTGLLASACLSMLAFMLAILFGIVESRHREQKHLVLEEATVIRAAFLRADLLHESHQELISGLLRDYVDLRVAAAKPGSVQRIAQEIHSSDELLGELWSGAVRFSLETPSRVTTMFLQSSEKVIELHQKRIALAARYRLPSLVWWVLGILAVLAMSIGGGVRRRADRHPPSCRSHFGDGDGVFVSHHADGGDESTPRALVEPDARTNGRSPRGCSPLDGLR